MTGDQADFQKGEQESRSAAIIIKCIAGGNENWRGI